MKDQKKHRRDGVRTGSEATRRSGDLAFGPPPPGPQWPGREPSEAERTGVPATDTQARSPLGVGGSTSRRAERIAEPEQGRARKGLRGRTRRPYGKVRPDHMTEAAPRSHAGEPSRTAATADRSAGDRTSDSGP